MAIATDFEKKTVVDKKRCSETGDKGFRSTECWVIQEEAWCWCSKKSHRQHYEYVRVAEVVEGKVIEKQMEGGRQFWAMQEGWAR